MSGARFKIQGCPLWHYPPGHRRERWRFLIRYPNGDERDVFSDSPHLIPGEGCTVLERERTFPDRGGIELEPDRQRRNDELRRLLAIAIKAIEHNRAQCIEYAAAWVIVTYDADPRKLQLRTYASEPDITDVVDLNTGRVRATVRRNIGSKPGNVWHTIEKHPAALVPVRPAIKRRSPTAADRYRDRYGSGWNDEPRGTIYEHEPTTSTTTTETAEPVHVQAERPRPQQPGLGFRARAREICNAFTRALRR